MFYKPLYRRSNATGRAWFISYHAPIMLQAELSNISFCPKFFVRGCAIVGVPNSFLRHTIANGVRLKAVGECSAALRLLLYPRNVGFRDGVPGRHVLLHAGSEAALLALGQRSAGLGHTTVEAVLVKFLGDAIRIYALTDERWQKLYLNQHAGVLHRSFLLNLAHNLSLGVATKRAHSAAERVHFRV